KYETILKDGKQSAELYFNLGNAHYKLDHIAPSIYYYEKALQLNPNDREIINNSVFAKNMTIDAIDTVPEVGFSKVMNEISRAFTFEGWGKFSISFMVLFVAGFLFYYFASTVFKKRATFVASALMLALAAVSLFFAFHNKELAANDRPAIVFAQESKVKSGPNLSSDEAFKLHEGTKVQILDTFNEWKKIKLTDGKTGWVPKDDIKAL
ncbi:MAG TPA: tetratricopeptide repeat protein, partial [Aquaticitalea sp.]|nr:tetratricopeptide repeat protein [Aquaticitalea sp.]